MGLIDEFLEEQDSRKPRQCLIYMAMERMEKDDRADLEAALDNPGIQHITITNVLRKNGYDIGKHSVSMHRRRQCACARG